jgi:hypothetical protein
MDRNVGYIISNPRCTCAAPLRSSRESSKCNDHGSDIGHRPRNPGSLWTQCWLGTDRILGLHDLVLVDAGGSLHGYFSDISRTFALKDSLISSVDLVAWRQKAAHTAAQEGKGRMYGCRFCASTIRTFIHPSVGPLSVNSIYVLACN